MSIDELNERLNELEKIVKNLETERRLKESQYDESINLMSEMYSKLKGVIGQFPEAITDTQNTNRKLVYKTRELATQQRDIVKAFNKITSNFENNIIEVVEKQRDLIHSMVNEKVDNGFDEAIKTLIVETQKNEINKAIEKALRDTAGSTTKKTSKGGGNAIMLILGGVGSFLLVIGLMILAIKFI